MDQIGNAAPQGAPPNLEDQAQALGQLRAQQATSGTNPLGGPDIQGMMGSLGGRVMEGLLKALSWNAAEQVAPQTFGSEHWPTPSDTQAPAIPPERVAQLQSGGLGGLLGEQGVGGLLGGLAGTGAQEAGNALRAAAVGITNPSNLIGLKLPAQAAEALSASGGPQALIHALEAMAQVERGTQWLMTAPFRGVGAATKGALERVPLHAEVLRPDPVPVPGLPGVTLPNTQKAPADNLWDYLSNQSRMSMLRLTDRQLFDAIVGHVRPRGAPLEADIADLAAARSGQLIPAFTDSKAAYPQLQQAEHSLYGMVDGLQSPYAKLGGLQVINEVEQRNARAWEELLVGADKLKATGASARTAWGNVYQQGYEEAIRNYEAGRTAIDRLARLTGNSASDNPMLDRQIGQLVSETLHEMGSARYSGPNGAGVGLYADKSGVYPKLRERFDNLDQQAQALQELLGTAQDRAAGLYSAASGHAPESIQQLLPGSGLASQMVGQRRAEQGLLEKGLPGVLAGLPAEQQGLLAKFWPAFEQHYKGISTGRQGVEEGLKALWDQSVPDVAYTPFKAGFGPGETLPTAQNWLAHINDTLGDLGAVRPGVEAQLGQGPVTSARDFYERFLQNQIGMPQSQKLKGMLDQYPAGDLLRTDPYLLSMDRVVRSFEDELGIKRNVATDALGKLNQLYKIIALMSLSYPVGNVLSGTLANSLEGVSASRTGGNIVRGLADMIRGKYQGPEHAQNLMTSIGKETPAAWTQAASGATNEVNPALELGKQSQNVAQEIGSAKLGAGFGLLGGVGGVMDAPQDAEADEVTKNALIHMLVGGTMGAALPGASKYWLHNLGGGLERAMRSEAGFTGTIRALHGVQDLPQEIARDALAQTQNKFLYVPGGPSLHATATPSSTVTDKALQGVSDATQNKALEAIAGRGPFISPASLQGILREAGVDATVAKDASLRWSGALDHAIQQGSDLSNHIHFDYAQLSNLEQFMKAALPFSTWATKALPFFGQHVLEQPLFLHGLLEMENQSEQQRQGTGFTEPMDRLKGAVKIPLLSEGVGQVLSGLLGHPVTPWFNPLRGFVPFADWAAAAPERGDDNPISGGLRLLQASGLPGPGPIPGTLLGAAVNDPARGVLRPASAIQGITSLLGLNRGRGLDLNAAQTGAESAVRGVLNRAIGAEGPPDVVASKAMNRLDEMALEANHGQMLPPGNALKARFEEAKVQRQGPLWDQAIQDVQRESGLRGMAGFVAQPLAPQATVSASEESLRQASTPKILDSRTSILLRRAATNTPDASVPSPIVDQVRTAALDLAKANWEDGSLPDGQMPPIMEQMLATGTARNVQQVVAWVRQERINRNPLAAGYGQAGSPETARLQTLMALYNNLPALMMRDPNMANVPSEDLLRIGSLDQTLKTAPPQIQQFAAQRNNSQTQLLLKYAKTRQDELAEQNPMLKAYLAYQQENAMGPGGTRGGIRRTGAGSLEDFIQNVWLPGQRVGLNR